MSIEEVRAAASEPTSEQVSLGRRFLRPETLLSFAVVAALLTFLWYRSGLDLGRVATTIGRANFGLLALAFAAYYLTFAIRARRWQILLANAAMEMSFPEALRIIVISWFANCIVPAKIGDIYRAYLARASRGYPGFRILGTVFAERVVDFVVLSLLLGFSALAVFRSRLLHTGGRIELALVVALVASVVLVGGILALRYSNGRISARMPARVGRVLSSLKDGLLNSLGRIPLIVGMSVVIWLLESARLYLVLAALGVPQSPLLVVFLALTAALLTTIPLTPAGAGAVEGAMFLILTSFAVDAGGGHVSKEIAASVAILDRVISYYSLILVGLVTFIATQKRGIRG